MFAKALLRRGQWVHIGIRGTLPVSECPPSPNEIQFAEKRCRSPLTDCMWTLSARCEVDETSMTQWAWLPQQPLPCIHLAGLKFNFQRSRERDKSQPCYNTISFPGGPLPHAVCGDTCTNSHIWPIKVAHVHHTPLLPLG